jgi:hypothetical protein
MNFGRFEAGTMFAAVSIKISNSFQETNNL